MRALTRTRAYMLPACTRATRAACPATRTLPALPTRIAYPRSATCAAAAPSAPRPPQPRRPHPARRSCAARTRSPTQAPARSNPEPSVQLFR